MTQAAEPKAKKDNDGLRVLLVDDHDLFRTGLRNLLEEQASRSSARRRTGTTLCGLCARPLRTWS